MQRGRQSFQTKKERKPPFEVESRGCCTCTSIAQERSPRSILSDSTQRYRNSENARGSTRARARARDRDSERERGRGRKDQWAVRGPGRANCRVSEGGTVEGRKEDSVRERERERERERGGVWVGGRT